MFMLAVGLFHYGSKGSLVGISRGKDVSCVPTSKLTIAKVGRAAYVRAGTTHYSGFILEIFSEIETPC